MNTKQLLSADYGHGMRTVEPCESVSWGATISNDVTKYTLSNYTEETKEALAKSLSEIKNGAFQPFLTISEDGTAVVLTEATPTSEGGEGVTSIKLLIDTLEYEPLLAIDSEVFLEHFFKSELHDNEEKNLHWFSSLLISYSYLYEYFLGKDEEKYTKMYAEELKEKHFKKDISFKEAQQKFLEYAKQLSEGEEDRDKKLNEKAKELLGISHMTSDVVDGKSEFEFDTVKTVINDAYNDVQQKLKKLAEEFKLEPAS